MAMGAGATHKGAAGGGGRRGGETSKLPWELLTAEIDDPKKAFQEAFTSAAEIAVPVAPPLDSILDFAEAETKEASEPEYSAIQKLLILLLRKDMVETALPNTGFKVLDALLHTMTSLNNPKIVERIVITLIKEAIVHLPEIMNKDSSHFKTLLTNLRTLRILPADTGLLFYELFVFCLPMDQLNTLLQSFGLPSKSSMRENLDLLEQPAFDKESANFLVDPRFFCHQIFPLMLAIVIAEQPQDSIVDRSRDLDLADITHLAGRCLDIKSIDSEYPKKAGAAFPFTFQEDKEILKLAILEELNTLSEDEAVTLGMLRCYAKQPQPLIHVDSESDPISLDDWRLQTKALRNLGPALARDALDPTTPLGAAFKPHRQSPFREATTGKAMWVKDLEAACAELDSEAGRAPAPGCIN